LRGKVRAEGGAEAEMAKAPSEPGAKEKHGRILGQAPSSTAEGVLLPPRNQ
jgi:hypothetical protein